MNIGLDIDNVITSFDSTIFQAFLEEDKRKRNKGIVNSDADHFINMFDWSQDEIDEFFAKNMESLAKTLRVRRDCKKYMDKLLADGHKLYLITHRAYPHYNDPEKTTLDWLNKHKIHYTKLVLSNSPDKTDECKKYKIDIMVDDRVGQCQKMRANGVECILMITKYNKGRKGDLPYAKSWADLYRRIQSWQ